ncbi:fumarylacetoacetate hydrolase family protein [Halobacteriovorax sp. GB3]|uniref:fumarylacetoacetate hydrolase family protein n=1 Tax=Halobacteriovorax sp. GB3 TaxID=2719615 RepID=UPI00235FA3C5|nr:fumarylacetoacetate hydrolase family protein [Halobacteriovorax sp. GB3]MDD0852409.1 fumarylacetoacetate hydrolase family protein [Halobacteriovorax sp. GB3]
MKICQVKINTSYGTQTRMGILINDNQVIDVNHVWSMYYAKDNRYNSQERADYICPNSLHTILTLKDQPIEFFQMTQTLFETYQKDGDLDLSGNGKLLYSLDDESIALTKPIDKITTYRDFYAHEKHVAKGFEKRNEPIPEAWYEIPAYYKGPSAGFIGPEDEVLWPHYSNILDYELELGVIVGKEGKNIKAENATDHIFGFSILNDISARDIQRKEMAIRLGPAKGKDFCSVIGPVITTIDEFNNKEPDLLMTATINGQEWSRGQSGDSHFSFSEMIAHVSMDEWVLPGDFMGSGTVGTGCGLEIDKWIQSGDTIELFVEGIGTLRNKIGNKRTV